MNKQNDRGPGKDQQSRVVDSEELERESRASFAQKSALKQVLHTGMHGPFQLRKKERHQHLGQFRERILKALTFEQIEEKGTYPEIGAALRDPRAKRLLISRQADLNAASEYIRLAREHGILFTTVDSPKYSGELGLIVVATEAVDVEDITVPSRREKLLSLGVPPALIDAVGEKICPRCFQLLEERAPGEVINYQRQSLFDRLLGSKCPCK